MSDILKELEKAYGKGIFKSASTILDRKRNIIPLTPRLNLATGGGLPEGSLAIFSGPEKFGKTTLALHAIKKSQQLFKKKAFYIDVERRIKPMNLNGIEGLDTDPENLTIISSEKGKLLTAEETLTIAEKLIKSEPGSIIVLDSSSALCSESEMVNDLTGQTRSLGPKLFAAFCRRCGNAIAVNDTVFIVIQHLINDTSGRGGGKMEDGGVKVQYQQDVKLRGAWKEAWKVGTGENEKVIGQLLHWKMLTGALEGNTPGAQVDTYLRYGYGMDELMEYVELASELNIVEKKGSWFTINKGQTDEAKFQGEEKLYQAIKSDKVLQDKMIGQIKEMTGM